MNNSYIQILFSRDNLKGHWICMYYSDNVIHIYDSWNQNSLHPHHETYLKKLFSRSNNLKIVYEKLHCQSNSYDSGVFAIAFSVVIIFNICPCSLNFSIPDMRKHLLNLYQTNTLQMFPLSSIVINKNIISVSPHIQCHQILKHEYFNFQINDNLSSINTDRDNICQAKDVCINNLTKKITEIRIYKVIVNQGKQLNNNRKDKILII